MIGPEGYKSDNLLLCYQSKVIRNKYEIFQFYSSSLYGKKINDREVTSSEGMMWYYYNNTPKKCRQYFYLIRLTLICFYSLPEAILNISLELKSVFLNIMPLQCIFVTKECEMVFLIFENLFFGTKLIQTSLREIPCVNRRRCNINGFRFNRVLFIIRLLLEWAIPRCDL